MLDNAVTLIFAAGIIQALFLAVSLATLKIRNKQAAYALAALMLLLAVSLMENFADQIGASTELALGLAIEFAIGPLLYIFVRSTAAPEWRVTRRTALHFIPMAIAFCLLALLHAANTGGNLGVAHPQFGAMIIFWVFVKLAYFCIYAVMSERVVRLAVKAAKPGRAASLRWIYRWLLLVFAAVAVTYALFILFLIGAPIWNDADVYAGIAVFVVIFSIAYFVLANRQALEHSPPKPAPVTPEIIQNAEMVRAYVEKERPHREPDFSIEQLSTAVKLSLPSIQSAVLHLGGGFQDYVNRLRLEEFEILARDPANKSKTTLEIAFTAGFNSKATFYRVFNAEKGVTPRAYRENL
ncbi:AraC family transcriptional regulator [Hyphococcus sp.]|uniref:AraC family transcriptional regulator n=1 Tax=Hyphococcus sp. TaxID=2038636 RepID=UPI00208D7B33|nr:MAG: hypothetical protein DHS20C04_26670 [Marinicaulis sp.]